MTVHSPKLGGKLPVAAWFHGGANVSGAGSLDWYNVENLARQWSMVVVGVNFRLGALGFLVHPALNEDNLSILDQVASLRWVHENIQAFWGDPGNVTVFGQSAGATAIIHMLSLPSTEGLFHRVILQRPSMLAVFVAGLVNRISPNRLAVFFVNGAAVMGGICLMIGFTKVIGIVLTNGKILHTIAYGALR